MRKEQSKLSKIFITILMALTCVQNITVFAEPSDGDSDENGIMLAAAPSEEYYTIAVGDTITLNGRSTDRDYWWRFEVGEKTPGVEHPVITDTTYEGGTIQTLNDSQAKFSSSSVGTYLICHKYYVYNTPLGYYFQHYIINVVEKRSAVFQTSISNSSVAYALWHDETEAKNAKLDNVDRECKTMSKSNYTMTDKPGYIVFFVKPDNNYLLTGFNNNGTRGDIYPLDGTNFGNISNYPGLADVVAKAKELGYVACFGYTNQAGEFLSTSFGVEGQQPTVSINASAEKLNAVNVSSTVPITVTINPQVLERTSVKNVSATAKINDSDTVYTVSDIKKQEDGKYTGTISYPVVSGDSDKGYVKLEVTATTTYESHVATVGESEIKKDFDITSTKTIEKLDILNKGSVSYTFSSINGQQLPQEVLDKVPTGTSEYYVGKNVTPINLEDADKTVRVDEGVWTFDHWNETSKIMTADGITFTGYWKFTQKTGKAGYYLTLKDAKWGETGEVPSLLTEVKEESGLTKYYYKKKLSKNETFEVVIDKPTAEGYQFIGWLDKERKSQGVKQEAAIREGGDELTYIYKESENHTYTLDALWANISVTGYKGKYDGQSHTISDEQIAINEGTELDPEYKEQAEALITIPEDSKLYYSTDTTEEKNWSETKPTFTDAGTYTVYVKQDVVLGKDGEEKTPVTLYGHGTVVIEERNVTLTSESKSKEYDGKALTATEVKVEGDGFVSGEVTDLKATGSITNVGEVTNTITYKTGDKFKKENYKITVNEGKLKVTEKKSDSKPTPTPTVNPGCPSGTVWNEGTKTCQAIVVPVTPTPRPTSAPTAKPTAKPTSTPEVTPSAEPTATPKSSVEPSKTSEPTASSDTIDDGDGTPNFFRQNHWALINLVAAVVSVILGIVLLLSKNKKDKDDDEEQYENEEVKRYKRWKVASVIDAILAVIVFILTENMKLPMVLVDKWTILMIIFAVVSIVSLVFGRKYHDEDEEETSEY